jgi:hypothetical protein
MIKTNRKISVQYAAPVAGHFAGWYKKMFVASNAPFVSASLHAK